ncbi:tRNA lysidine(34) synthetase TilS [Telluribacter sp. SYSU D00476]|uniref:tRNA lysidine(34) synthetase TilS n=1 Tax=Telluribacter sp. SYSU D00476 TaxID=2811430 RepID=UPI001FF572E1|nr:tRNA lysidine(34) synthetase TilS [Telluribacter sp. SYSU D00476]
MLDAFLTFINAHKIPLPQDRTLLTVSGGIDSVVMVDLFSKAGLHLGIAHCNFGLRGEESEVDELFVKELAEQYGVPFYTKRFDTAAYARDRDVSTQMAARDLRYAWFEEVRRQEGYDYIATAHHSNDAIETVLLNLVRGTGLAGLRGITFRNGALIRPLLFASREQIEQYAAIHSLRWREDSSNQSTYYRRNLLRHQVVPVLRQINPSLEDTFQLTAERLRAAEALLAAHMKEWQQQAVRTEGAVLRISIASLLQATEPVYRLAELLQPHGFTYQQAQQIVNTLEGLAGKLFQSPTHTLVKDRTELLLMPTPLPSEEVLIEESSTMVQFGPTLFSIERLARPSQFQIATNPHTATFDSDKLKYPLRLRSWRQGDWFCPLGMGGKKKKVSDLLVNLKIPRTLKETIPVLVDSQDQIVWVAGLRPDHRFRITDQTTHLTLMTMTQGHFPPA